MFLFQLKSNGMKKTNKKHSFWEVTVHKTAVN